MGTAQNFTSTSISEYSEEQIQSCYRLIAASPTDDGIQDSTRPDGAATLSNALMHMQIEGKLQDKDELSAFSTDRSTISVLSGSSSVTTDEEMEMDEFPEDEPMDNGKEDIKLVLVFSLQPNMHLYSNNALKAFSGIHINQTGSRQ